MARQSLPTAFLTLVAVAVAALYFGRSAGAAAPLSDGQLPSDRIAAFASSYPGWARALALCSLLATSLSLGRLVNRFNLYAGRCYLSIPIFGIAACGMTGGTVSLTQCLSALLLALVVKNFCLAFRNGYGFNPLLRASLYLGLLPLVCPPALPLVLLLPLAVTLFRRTLREISVALFGLLLPVFTLCYLSWAGGASFTGPVTALTAGFSANLRLPDLAGPATLTALTAPTLLAGSLLLLGIGAIAMYLQNIYSVGHKARLILAYCICLFVLCLGVVLFSQNPLRLAVLGAVPVAVLLPLLFLRAQHAFSLVVYLLLLVGCFISTL